MSFTNVEFLFFLPLVFLLYWIGPGVRSYQNTVLLFASYIFFGSWHWQLLLLILAGTWLDYFISHQFARLDDDNRHRKRWLFVSLAFSLGTLCFFKYAGFFAVSANEGLRALGLEQSLPVLKLILPLGISYWTLQRVGYMLDCYWRRVSPAESLLDFSLFVCFFGQVAAGPISRASELLPQLQKARKLTPDWLSSGCFAFLLGYTLKAFAGEFLGENLVAKAFSAPGDYNSLSLWIGVAAFAAQVFSDFAGYSLMAIGTARLFAVELPQNFNNPFLSKSLPELWRRWHITLNRWLFDYIFTPMTTSKGWFRNRLDLGLFCVFLASGLWHGAAWTFILWGLLQALGMIVHRNWDVLYRGWCRKNRAFVTLRKSLPYGFVSWALTITFFILTLVPFRSADMETAGIYYHGMLNSAGELALSISPMSLLAIILICALHFAELRPFDRMVRLFQSAPAVLRGVVYGLAVAILVLAVPFSSGTFIYQQF